MTTHDFIAIGVGPFNLGLACLVDPIEELDGLFLEREPEFNWHPGMLLETSTLQTPFLSDLVTLADPTSRFSFLNYLKNVGRLYSFYIRESFHPLRTEYNDYCRWVAEQLDSIRFNRHVEAVEYDGAEDVHVVHALHTATGVRETHRGQHLVLGTGTPPHVPTAFDGLPGEALHSSRYLSVKADLQEKRSVTVVGSGQSAAEIYHDLLEDIDRFGYALNWITRAPRFFPLEYTKLTLEMTSPDYMDYFHDLPAHTRDRLVASQSALYKGIDASLISDIFDLLYRKKARGCCPTRLLTNTEVVGACYDAPAEVHVLDLHQVEQDQRYSLRTEGLMLATGYRYQVPAFLAPIADRIAWDERGRFDVRRNYRIDTDGSAIFAQNAELYTHGFGAPDLGLAAYRNSWIIRELLGREHYAIERSITFQEFGVDGHRRRHEEVLPR